MWWKVLALADVAISIGYWRSVLAGRTPLERFDLVANSVAMAGSLGLISYAFSIQMLPPLLWRILLPIFLLVSGWEIAKAVDKHGAVRDAYIGAIPALLLVGFTSIALYRLGGERWIGVLGV